VHEPPAQVKIWFTEKLEPALSKIQVFDASGKQVDKRDVQASKTDAVLLIGIAFCITTRQIQGCLACRVSRHTCYDGQFHV
jgi:methionine-rich copper-binding protein CopC